MKDASLIVPSNIDARFLDSLKIYSGIRTIVAQLMKHGYDTRFSCEGHLSRGVDTIAYIAWTRGTGDGSFEKSAHLIGFYPRKQNPCCQNKTGNFCGKCGWSDTYSNYWRRGSIAL